MKAERVGVPDFLLEQYALGELPASEQAGIDEALRADPGLRDRLAELERSNEEILREAPPSHIAASIRGRMLSSSSPRAALRAARRARPFGPGAGLIIPLAAALLVLVGGFAARTLFLPTAGELTRPKGGAPSLSIFRKAASGPVELRDGEAASAGDLLQLKYSAAGARYGAIFSLDGRGGITRHLPPGGEPAARSPRLSEAGAALGEAYELDDAPGFERFFIVSSGQDFDLGRVASALRDLASSGGLAATAAPRLPAGLEWKSLLLVKKAAAR